MLFVVLLIGIVSAETFQQNIEVDFKKSCTNSTGMICSPSAYCNMTIKYPNSTASINDLRMTNNNNGIFNITIPSSNVEILGDYNWDMFCCDNADCGEAHGIFKITKSGGEISQEKAIVYIAMIALLVIIFLLCLAGVGWLPDSNAQDEDGMILSINKLKYVRSILYAVAYALLIGIIFLASNVSYLFLETPMMGNFLFMVYRVMMYLAFPMVVVWFIFIFVKMYNDKEIKNMLDKGIPVEGKI